MLCLCHKPAGKERMMIVYYHMDDVSSTTNVVHVSTRQHDDFQAVAWKLSVTVAMSQAVNLPISDPEPPWPSMLRMFN